MKNSNEEHNNGRISKTVALLSSQIRLIEKSYSMMNDETMLRELIELQNICLVVHSVHKHQIYDLVKSSKFERTLISVISSHYNNLSILRAATELFIFIFGREDDWIERIASAGIIPIYEKLMIIPDAELTENVG